MFSHLCRACLKEMKNSSERVPLFESYKNIWYHRLISTTFRWSLSKDDNLADNICKCCAIEILKSFKFRLKYIGSNRKLHEMLNRSEKKPADDSGKIPSATAALRWKCNLCSSRFASRTLYREHRKLSHPKSNQIGQQKCSAEFPTKTLKLSHETEHQSDMAALIHEDDLDHDESITPNITEVIVVDVDQNTLKFIDQHPVVNVCKWKCRVCTETFRTRDLLREHNRLHTVSKSSRKQVVKIEKVKNILTAKEEHTGDGQAFVEETPKWKCKTCLSAFQTRELLRIHRRTHLEQTETSVEMEPNRSTTETGVDQRVKRVKIEWQLDE